MVHFLFCQTFLSLEMSRGWDERTQTTLQAEEQITSCRSASEHKSCARDSVGTWLSSAILSILPQSLSFLVCFELRKAHHMA